MFNINNKNLISFGFGLLVVASFAIIAIPVKSNAYGTNSINCGPNCQGVEFYQDGDSGNYNYNNNNNNNNYNNYNSNSTPSISSVSPNSARTNSNTVITVTGSGFTQGSVVRWNSSDRPTSFVNSSILTAKLDYYDMTTEGDYLITVFNPSGMISNAVLFTVNNVSIYSPDYSGSATSTSSKKSKTATATTKNTSDADKTANQPTTGTEVKDLAAGAIFGSNAFMPSSLLQWIFFAIFILLAVVLWRKLYVSDADKAVPLKHS